MRLELIEPTPIEDDFVTALARVEDCGSLMRLVYYVRATCYETGGQVNVVKRKILLPYESVAASRALVTDFLAGRPPRTPHRHLSVAR